jgi:GNAT superfamily N-acetyltransferase
VSLRVETLTGPALDAALADLARLRIAVFREWPYLYEGSEDYEARYLRAYRDRPGAILVVAREGERIVGAATGMPLEDHADASGIEGLGVPRREVFYCAESVLLPEHRGQGAGHAFFDARETHARALGRTVSLFCAVERPLDHPARPPGYRPLDAFWRRRGYEPAPGARATFRWADLGEAEETPHALRVWMRRL